MDAIVAVTENWGIGIDGDMIFHIRSDLKRFKALTMGHTVIMGRRTFECLPGRKGLPGRTNYVLTKDSTYQAQDCTVVSSLNDLPMDDAFCIGGSSVFSQLLPLCSRVYVTKIFETRNADSYFPNLDTDSCWKITSVSDVMEEDGIRFQYVEYEKD